MTSIKHKTQHHKLWVDKYNCVFKYETFKNIKFYMSVPRMVMSLMKQLSQHLWRTLPGKVIMVSCENITQHYQLWASSTITSWYESIFICQFNISYSGETLPGVLLCEEPGLVWREHEEVRVLEPCQCLSMPPFSPSTPWKCSRTPSCKYLTDSTLDLQAGFFINIIST